MELQLTGVDVVAARAARARLLGHRMHSYAGAGATIGPAMTFGYIAARTMAGAR